MKRCHDTLFLPRVLKIYNNNKNNTCIYIYKNNKNISIISVKTRVKYLSVYIWTKKTILNVKNKIIAFKMKLRDSSNCFYFNIPLNNETLVYKQLAIT